MSFCPQGGVPAWSRGGSAPNLGGCLLQILGGCLLQIFGGGVCSQISGGCLLQISGGVVCSKFSGGVSNFRNTVNVRPVRILLECILLVHGIFLKSCKLQEIYKFMGCMPRKGKGGGLMNGQGVSTWYTGMPYPTCGGWEIDYPCGLLLRVYGHFTDSQLQCLVTCRDKPIPYRSSWPNSAKKIESQTFWA